MAELRSKVMYISGIINAWKSVALLFERKTRILAVELMLYPTGAVLGGSRIFLTKVDKDPAHQDVAVLAGLVSSQPFTTSGMAQVAESIFIDFRPDYFEVEEDDYLYLGGQSSVAAVVCEARAILYYAEV